MATQTQEDMRPLPKQVTPYQGPNYQGFVFTLVSGSGKPNHTLTITTQMPEVFLAPPITGTWQGDGEPKSFTGVITGTNGDAIECYWTTPNGGTNVLLGTLALGEVVNRAYLDGNVTAYDANGNVLPGNGPGHVYGEGYRPWVVFP